MSAHSLHCKCPSARLVTTPVFMSFVASQYAVHYKTVPVEGGDIVVRCVIPAGDNDSTYPVLVWFHGGGQYFLYDHDCWLTYLEGWVIGDIDVDDNHLKSIGAELQLAIVNVSYRYV